MNTTERIKAIKMPEQLLAPPTQIRSLMLDGCTIVSSCTHLNMLNGSMLLSEHLFVVVMEGRYVLRTGDRSTSVERHEAVLVKKAHAVDYQKIGYVDGKPYEAMMFFLKDEFLKEFIALSAVKRTERTADAEQAGGENHAAVLQLSIDDKLVGFLESVKPYFDAPEQLVPGLLRIKIMELLFNLSRAHPALFSHLLEFSNPAPQDLHRIMEANFTKPLRLSEFAYLAGRSLASFKRDFAKVYHVSPAKWIMQRRLGHARDLILGSDMDISDACYEAGFESVAHFSRLFKQHFGATPSALRSATAPVRLHSQPYRSVSKD